MEIGILGGGISGCFLAIKIKEKHPEYNVTIIDHNDKINKKIYATGNGKCNFANINSPLGCYKNENFALNYLNKFDYKDISSFFTSIGIPNILEDNLAYPMSKSAQTVGIMIEKRIRDLGISYKLSQEILDYEKNGESFIVKLDSEIVYFDKIIFATGGKSSPQLGSNGSIFEILKKHNYSLSEMHPSLCPIKTKENTKMVEGVRCFVNCIIKCNNNIIHEEKGELLFKDDGLSGIVIFNASHYINLYKHNEIKIQLDFAPLIKEEIPNQDYLSYVNVKLATYLLSNHLDIHNTIFTFKDFYDYKNSQVTSGGLSLTNINENFESLSEKGVFFIGEMLDVDAICGGYNIMWCYASASHVAEVL